MSIFLDNAATTPVHPEVVKVMTDVLANHYGNPSSIHAKGREVRALIEQSRRQVAELMGCTPGEIFFTSGGTEADNMAIKQSVENLGVTTIITSAIEHHAVLHTIEELAKAGKVKMELVKIDNLGRIDLNNLENLLAQNQHVLVSLMHSNNELGNILDIEKVGAMCQKYNALFHCDTVQTVGHYNFNLAQLNIDFLAAGAHKFNGPKGVGFIYINQKNKLKPLLTGGSQERNMRGGTENVSGIVGMAKALELSCSHIDEDKVYLASLKQYMIQSLENAIPGVKFNGDAKGHSSEKVLNVSFPPTPIAEMLLFKLDIAGIYASGGSACSSGSNVGSHVLTAIGTSPDRPAVRFSFGMQNTKTEIDFVVETLSKMLNIAKPN